MKWLKYLSNYKLIIEFLILILYHEGLTDCKLVTSKERNIYPRHFKQICCLWFLKDHIQEGQLMVMATKLVSAIQVDSHYWRMTILKSCPSLLTYRSKDEFEAVCLNYIKYGKKLKLTDKFKVYYDLHIRPNTSFLMNLIK